jgi:hypothetical protein
MAFQLKRSKMKTGTVMVTEHRALGEPESLRYYKLLSAWQGMKCRLLGTRVTPAKCFLKSLPGLFLKRRKSSGTIVREDFRVC